MMAYSVEIEHAGQIEPGRIAAAEIEDPRGHLPEDRERLQQLLASGAPARPDPKRTHVFEIQDQERIFYVHIAKPSKVTLLAVWNRDTADNAAI